MSEFSFERLDVYNKAVDFVDTFGGAQTPSFRAGKECAALSINPEQATGFSLWYRRIDNLFSICNKFPVRLQNSLGGQLRRASLSIINNIAEGSDKR